MSGGFPYLTVLVLLPAAGAVVVALLHRAPRVVAEGVGVAFSLATLGFALAMAVSMKTRTPGYQFVSFHQYVPHLGVSWNVGVDGISMFLVVLAAVLFPIALLGARARRDAGAFVAWMLLLEASCIGAFVSLDLLLFFFFFELTLVPSYFVISGWGYERRAYAAVKFFVYTFLGSAFLLVGILAVAFLHQEQTGVLSFSLPVLEHTHFTSTEGVLLFLAFTAAFAVKAPLFPLHTWSPDAYGEAPTGGSMILAAVLAKLGTYGIIRFDLNLFPQASHTLAPLMLTLAVIGILYGAVVACAQRDLKRLVAYSSLAQIGFIALGTFAFTSEALSGGVLLMLNHGIIVAALFLLIGWLYERRRTWQVTALRGLQGAVPVMAAVFTVVMLASIGLPGLNGFVSEFLVLAGTFLTHRWWAAVATFGVVLAALYLLWAYQQVFHGPPDEPSVAGTGHPGLPAGHGDHEGAPGHDHGEGQPAAAGAAAGTGAPGSVAVLTPGARTRDLTWAERLVIAPLILLIVLLGVYPKPVLDRINPSVDRLVARVELANRVPLSRLPSGVPGAARLTGGTAAGGTAAGGAAAGGGTSDKVAR